MATGKLQGSAAIEQKTTAPESPEGGKPNPSTDKFSRLNETNFFVLWVTGGLLAAFIVASFVSSMMAHYFNGGMHFAQWFFVDFLGNCASEIVGIMIVFILLDRLRDLKAKVDQDFERQRYSEMMNQLSAITERLEAMEKHLKNATDEHGNHQ